MSSIIVETDALTAYGNDLDQKATEFTAITNEMSSIISSLSGSWEGDDAQNFIANATAYLSNLKVIENAFKQFGNSAKNHSVKYGNRVADFYSLLG